MRSPRDWMTRLFAAHADGDAAVPVSTDWIEAARTRQRTTRRLLLSEGDSGAEPVTKIGGTPWWPRGVPRPRCDRGHEHAFYMQIRLSDVPGWASDPGLLSFHYCDQCTYDGTPAIGWYQPGIEGMDELAHPEASDVRILVPTGDSDGLGVVVEGAVRPRRATLETVEEIPCPDDLPDDLDLPDSFFGGTDYDPERPEGFAFVARCKVGGWPAWDQNADWPTCEPHGRMEFIAQIDAEVGEDSYWGGGGHAFLFACPPSCPERHAELVIQTT